jgi:hypothetical protein
VLNSWRGRVSIVAHLRFHPQNAFVTVPPYELTLAGPAGERAIAPLETRRTPVYSTPGPGRR